MTKDSKEFAFYSMITLILMVILFWFWVFPAYPLAKEYESSLTNELNWFILRAPPYIWGASRDTAADCSGYLYRSCARAGIPVLRTTAYQMALGGGAWSGRDIELDDAGNVDLVWWTFNPMRKHGHVGAFLIGTKSGLLQVTHASPSRRGVVLDVMKGKLITDISKVRRLTIGDPK
jgi:hypothetical protein